MDPFAAVAARAALRQSFMPKPAPVEPVPPLPIMQREKPIPPPPPVHTRLDEKIAHTSMDSGEFAQYAEINRITELPIVHSMTPEEVEAYSRANVLVEAWNNPSMGVRGNPGFRLFAEQAECVFAYEMVGGLIGALGVGDGKTAVTLMIADKAFRKGVERSCLFIPPEVYIQLYGVDVRWLRARVPLSVPIHWMPGKDTNSRRSLAQSGKRGLYVYTYSLLSAKDAEENLTAINPSLVILDECQRVRDRSAARTQRLMRYLDGRAMKGNPVEIVALSGTITSKSIKDYHHLVRGALGQRCPMPLAAAMVEEWAAVIDAPASASWDENAQKSGAGPLLPLVHWAQRNFPRVRLTEDVHGFRKAFRLRLDHSEGIVNSSETDRIGTSLIISNHPVQHPEHFPGFSEVERLIKQVDEMWLTPNGDEIEYSIHTWKWKYELTAGFYNQLTWPTDETLAARRKINLPEAQDILDKAMFRHGAGQGFHKELRHFLQDESGPGLDTPLLVTSHMGRHQQNPAENPLLVPQELYDAWRYWHSLDFELCPERDSTAVRICDFKIQAAVEWAKMLPKGKGALIWIYHQEIGQWVYEALCAAGINAMHCPAGGPSNAAILDHGNVNKVIVASLTAHGTGKNLQHFQEQFFVQWPRQASQAEQVIGRTHRTGQQAEELVVWTCNTGLFDDMNFAACLNDALYIHQTRNKQKLIYANYHPLPRIFPSAVLFERGFNNNLLTNEQEQALVEKFGQETAA